MIIFEEPDVFKKINWIRQNADAVLTREEKYRAPLTPARDVQVSEFKLHPPKKGLSTKEGQARMLHDLASIELQAMELGVRTLAEFQEAPLEFKEELLEISLSEASHLEMCLTQIESLGFKWGDWPVNCGLWEAVNGEHDLIDRVLIVHRYLEGSGLDSGDTLIRRLNGVGASSVLKVVETINKEEVGHVLFGSSWYRKLCKIKNIDPEFDFFERLKKLRGTLPKRISPINTLLRQKSGFTDAEIEYLTNLRLSFLEKDSEWKKIST